MATVNGLTAERMLEIEAASIVDGDVVAGNLILTKHDGSQINAGAVVGPTDATGSTGAAGQGVPTGGSTGQALVKNSGTNYDTAWSTITVPTVPIGTTLPASPSNNDEAILVDSLTAPTYSWRFRYVSGITGANKWIFIGGAPWVSVVGSGTIASASYTDFPSSNPSMVAPRAGLYLIRIGGSIYGTAGATSSVYVAPKIGASAAADPNAARVENVAPSLPISVARTTVLAAAASDVIKTQGRAVSGSIIAQYVFMEVQPMAVA